MIYSTDDLGYSRTLTKQGLFDDISESSAESIQGTLPTFLSNSVSTENIQSGELTGNLSIVAGYMQSANFTTGVNGWKFDASGNLEANSGTFRGTLYATVGSIGGWILDSDGLYYNGNGTPSIRTSEDVESGDNGVILDKDGIRVYSSSLGQVVNLPSNGTAPSFASGVIEQTIFKIDTQAVIRTSDTVGDGTSSSAGVLINNSGIYACGAYQTPASANVKLLKTGDGYFKGTIEASQINASTIVGADITSAVITGGLFRTAETGQRTEINSDGIELKSGDSGNTYSDATRLYNDDTYKYGNGVLGYVNNSTYKVPFYINAEQTVADAHFFNRAANPTGPAEVGDLCVVNKRLMICVTAGTPGGWEAVGAQAAISSISASLSPSASPSVSTSLSPSVSPSASPSVSPSAS